MGNRRKVDVALARLHVGKRAQVREKPTFEYFPLTSETVTPDSSSGLRLDLAHLVPVDKLVLLAE